VALLVTLACGRRGKKCGAYPLRFLPPFPLSASGNARSNWRLLCRRGRTAEDIFRSFPSIGSLAKVHGVITFILEHPQEIEGYFQEEQRFYGEFEANHPLLQEMKEPFKRALNENASVMERQP
jgi:hypothetical protein